jgi:hypothetical protein
MLASLFQFSFLCVVALANLCLGFAIASRLGWGPRLAALFQFDQAIPIEPFKRGELQLAAIDVEEPTALERPTDGAEPDSVEPIVSNERTSEDADESDDGSWDSDVVNVSELTTATGGG